jgi:hypothetical protein
MIWALIRAQFTWTRIGAYLVNLLINLIVASITATFVGFVILMAIGFNPYT